MLSYEFSNAWYRDKWLWGLLILSFLLLIPVLLEPLAFDNAINESLAADFIHYGRIPYLQSFDHNFPGIILIHCVEVLLFGISDIGFRVFDVLLQLAFAAFFYRLMLTWLERRTAFLAAILYILYYVSAGSGVYGQRDVYIGMIFLLAAGLLIKGTSKQRIILSGFLLGLAFLIRPTSLLLIVLTAIFLYLNEELRPVGNHFWRVAIFLGSSMIPPSLFLIYMSQYHGGLNAMYEAIIRFNLDVHLQKLTPGHPLWELIRSSPLIAFGILGLSASSAVFVSYPSKRMRYFYVFSIVATLGIVVIQQKYFRYHFAPFYMLLVPSAAVGISTSTSKINNAIWAHWAVLVSLALCSYIRFNPTSTVAFGLAVLSHDHDPLNTIANVHSNDSLFGPKTESDVIRYFNRPRNRDGLVEICSTDPTLQLHLDRPSATGYPALHMLATAVREDEHGEPVFTEYQRQWQRNYIDSLRIIRPAFIVVARHMKYWAVPDLNDSFLNYIPSFDSLLRISYSMDTVLGGYEVYRLRT